MSDEQTDAVAVPVAEKKAKKPRAKQVKEKVQRKPREDYIGRTFGPRGVIAARAYFSAHPEEKKPLMDALKAKAVDPAKIQKIQDRIAVLTARLNAMTNSEVVVAQYKAKLQSVANTIFGTEA